MATPILPSAKLHAMVQALNAQIRQEYGNGNYAMLGQGQGACLVGVDEQEMQTAMLSLMPRMALPRPAAPALAPRRAPAMLPFKILPTR